MDKNIYSLKLHEYITIKAAFCDFTVIRVPGGWIYVNPRLDSGQMNTIFVPFNDEFKIKNNSLQPSVQAEPSTVSLGEKK